MKDVVKTNYKYILVFLLVFLLSFLFFQIGIIYGSKFYQPCEIKIFKNGNN